MTDDNAETEAEEEIDEQPDVTVDLSPGDSVTLEELYEEFPEEVIDADLEEVVKNRVRMLYDNREEVRQRLAQAAQQAQGGQGQPPVGPQ